MASDYRLDSPGSLRTVGQERTTGRTDDLAWKGKPNCLKVKCRQKKKFFWKLNYGLWNIPNQVKRTYVNPQASQQETITMSIYMNIRIHIFSIYSKYYIEFLNIISSNIFGTISKILTDFKVFWKQTEAQGSSKSFIFDFKRL